MASANSSVVVMAMVMVALVSSAVAVPGIASIYTPITPTSCVGSEDRGVLIASASDSIWDNRGACGRRYMVRCTGGTNSVPNPCRVGNITVTILDYCPGCASIGVTMELSQEAFAMIANPDVGRIQIDYTQA